MFTNTSIPSAKAWDGSESDVNICFIQKESNGDITFTVNPEIQGPSQLCGTRDYCVSGIVPDKDVITWSYSTDIISKKLPTIKVFTNIISIQFKKNKCLYW